MPCPSLLYIIRLPHTFTLRRSLYFKAFCPNELIQLLINTPFLLIPDSAKGQIMQKDETAGSPAISETPTRIFPGETL